MRAAVAIVILLGIIIGVIFVIQRLTKKEQTGPSDGGDIIAYLLLALAVGTAGFSLAALARAAFPGNSVVFNTPDQVATSLAGLVVAGPIAVLIWRRQAERRTLHPDSGGWTVYLAIMEAVFLGAFVFAAFSFLDWLIGEGSSPQWTDVLIFGGIVVFHQVANAHSPPSSDAAGLPRVVGSAIGLTVLVTGVGGALYYVFEEIYSSFAAQAGGTDLGDPLAAILIGAPIWYWRWWRPWPTPPAWPRQAWLYVVSTISMATTIGVVTLAGILTISYFTSAAADAGLHFDFLPGALAVAIVAELAWFLHRSRLASDHTSPLEAYQYSLAALGIGTAVGAATWLAALAFDNNELVTPSTEAVVATAIVTLVGAMVWLYFWSAASRGPREEIVTGWPRRFYLLGLAVIMGLTAAGSLIATLVVLFQMAFDAEPGDSLAVSTALFIFSGAVTWHLLRENAKDREMIVSEDVVTPFAVTLICYHPGQIASKFPEAARLRVIYTDDEAAVVSEEMAAEIVEAVGHRSSIVWVEGTGFRIAGAREQ
ncbi:MAG: DUF5671 domain-containing protein [Acidimicrobiia bacterium]